MGVFFIRWSTRLVLLAMRSRTLRPARALGTMEAALRAALGLVDRYLRLRSGRGLLVGMGYRTPVYRLLRLRPCWVFPDGFLRAPCMPLRVLTRRTSWLVERRDPPVRRFRGLSPSMRSAGLRGRTLRGPRSGTLMDPPPARGLRPRYG